MRTRLPYFFVLCVIPALLSCSEIQEGCTDPAAVNFDPVASIDDGSCIYDGPTPYELEIPRQFELLLPPPVEPAGNPLTVEGIALGRKLFFDPVLSADGSLACGGCHIPAAAFGDNVEVPVGITGIAFQRNTLPLFNVAWKFNEQFNWNGTIRSVHQMVLATIPNEIGFQNTWEDAIAALENDPEYPAMFKAAFGGETITATLVARAIEQFVHTVISGDSKFDKYLREEINLSPAEFRGLELFMTEEGDCFHCHGSPGNPMWTDNEFHNNGLDEVFTDLGLGEVTGDVADNGKFKTPTLRNLAYTAPYMHDGRFETLDEVLDHYSSGVRISPTTDPLMQFAFQGGVQMTEDEKADLKAFLMTLNDETFINNPEFQAP
jgi:cytochrome c peroxidase